MLNCCSDCRFSQNDVEIRRGISDSFPSPNMAFFRICDQRRPLVSAYRDYFKGVRWMVAESPGPEDFQCKKLQPGDPHICILEKTGGS